MRHPERRADNKGTVIDPDQHMERLRLSAMRKILGLRS